MLEHARTNEKEPLDVSGDLGVGKGIRLLDEERESRAGKGISQ